MEKYFKELDVMTWSEKTIIVDIDGTITIDGGSNFDPSVLKKVQEMALSNYVFLFSNKKLPIRDNEIADRLNVPLLKTPFKKPNEKVINGLPNHLKKNLVVIGDKILTDGLFAKNVGAEFTRVKRLTSKNDNLKTRLLYLLDNCVGYFIS
jgi:predicted HAD superfamily phosphohydrolase YqeG